MAIIDHPVTHAISEYPEYVYAMRHMGKRVLTRWDGVDLAQTGPRIALHCQRWLSGQAWFKAAIQAFEHFVEVAKRSGWTTSGIHRIRGRKDFKCNLAHRVHGFASLTMDRVLAQAQCIVGVMTLGEPTLDYRGEWRRPGLMHWPIEHIEWFQGPHIIGYKDTWELWALNYEHVNLQLAPLIDLYPVPLNRVQHGTLAYWRRSPLREQRPTCAYRWTAEGGGDAVHVVDRVFVRLQSERYEQWDATRGIIDAFARNGRRVQIAAASARDYTAASGVRTICG